MVNVDQLNASENPGANGVEAFGGGTVVQLSNSNISHNGTGINIGSGATVFSYKNNVVNGNGVNLNGTLQPNNPF